MKLLRLFFLLPVVLLVLLGGCASTVDPKDETVSVVFGYIDMTLAPAVLKEVSIRKFSGWTGNIDTTVERNAWSERGGMFWHMGIKPGAYQIYSFGNDKYRYNFDRSGKNESAIQIDKPGIYYMGSYSYTSKPAQVAGPGAFDLKPIRSPSEVDLVERLIQVMESKKDDKVYVRQYNWLKKRLSELKR